MPGQIRGSIAFASSKVGEAAEAAATAANWVSSLLAAFQEDGLIIEVDARLHIKPAPPAESTGAPDVGE